MLKELLISVVSGVIVALILQIFRTGRRGEARPVQARGYAPPPPRRRGGMGGLMRFIAAVAGGLVLAYAAAPFLLGFARGERGPRGRFGDEGPRWFGGGYDGYDRFDGFFGLPPMLVLTIVATIIVWAVLSAVTRR